MSEKSMLRSFLPLLLIFAASTLLFIVAREFLERWNISTSVSLGGNLILFIATLVSFILYWKSLHNNRVQVFLRMIYGGMFIKMMIVLFAALIYIMIAGKGVNKPAVFVCMFLYFVYTFVEIGILMKASKIIKHGQRAETH